MPRALGDLNDLGHGVAATRPLLRVRYACDIRVEDIILVVGTVGTVWSRLGPPVKSTNRPEFVSVGHK